MPYCSILVELAGDSGLEPRLQVARSLADRFQATLIGMHAMPLPFIPGSYGEAAVYMPGHRSAAQGQPGGRERVQAAFRSVCGEGPRSSGRRPRVIGATPGGGRATTDLLLAEHGKVGGTDAPDVLDQLVTATGVPVWRCRRKPRRARPGGAGRLERFARGGAGGARCAALPQRRRWRDLCAIGERGRASLDAAAAMLRRHGVAVQPAPGGPSRTGTRARSCLRRPRRTGRICWSWAPTATHGCASSCSAASPATC